MQHSESLLTEILLLLQHLNSNVRDFQKKLTDLETDIVQYRARIDGIINTAFPQGLVEVHAKQHAALERRGYLRRFLKWIDRKLEQW